MFDAEFWNQLNHLPAEAPWFIISAAFALGCCFGSFANVAIYRLPRNCLSIVKPRSFCPACKTPIKGYDNIPLVSWLALGGKCRSCKIKIPLRYPLVEMLTGVLVALLAWRVIVAPAQAVYPFGLLRGEVWLIFAVWAAATIALLIASWIDFQMKIIPDSISLGGAVVMLGLAPLVPMVHSWGVPRDMVSDPLFFSPLWPDWQRAWLTTLTLMLVSAAALWLIGWLGMKLFRKEAEKAGGAMGLGDVKLIMLMAGLLGWPKLLLAFMLATVAGVIIGFPKLWRKWVLKRDDESGVIPFGPFLSLGTFLAMLASEPMFAAVRWYLDVIGGRAI